MGYFNKIVRVTYEELLTVMPEGTLSSLLYHGKIQRVNRGGSFDRHVRHDYPSLSERYRTCFEQKYGDPVELIKEQCIKGRLRIDDAARAFFKDYRYDRAGERASLIEKKKEKYAISASALDELISILNGRESHRKVLDGSTEKV